MSDTITLKTIDGHLREAEYDIAITAGGTVTFVSDGGTAILCFADETAAILNPSPSGPETLAEGGSVTYTFGTADPGGYPVVVVDKESEIPAVIDFEPGASAVLTVSVRGGRSYGDDTGKGT
jgi:hypothetical protein